MKKYFLIFLLLLMAGDVFGISLSGFPYSQKITLTGTGSDETNYIVRLNVHRGLAQGDTTTTDIFLGGFSQTDFDDVRFTDSAGTELTYYRAGYGNYEIIKDNTKLGEKNIILSNGSILATGQPLGQGIWLSTNNGTSYSNVYNSTEAAMIFKDSQGNVFACSSVGTASGSHLLLKNAYTDAAHTTWTTELDMSAVSGIGLHSSMAEDADGNLYFGMYTPAQPAVIYKSTDRGDNWTSVYSSASYIHIHGVYVDTNVTPNAIYAGADSATGGVILKSVNAGVDWAVLAGTPLDGAFNQMYAGVGYRVFGGEASVYGGYTLFRTTDDATFTPVVQTAHIMTGLQELNGNLYAFGGANGVNGYAMVYRSTDGGANWQTALIENYNTSASTSAGFRYATAKGTPTGSSEQVMVGALDTDYSHIRIFDGGTHYQSTFYINVASLPAAGGDIYVWYGNGSVSTTSAVTAFPSRVQANLVARWKLNEGSGTAIDDASANNRDGVLTAGTGSWNSSVEGRRAGAFFPGIKQTGTSFNFAGDGYIEITDSDTDAGMQFTKNFTYVAWIRTTDSSTTLRQVVGKNGLANPDPIGLYIRTSQTIAFYYGSGVGYTNKASTLQFRNAMDGGWHMIACTVSNDATPTVFFTIDSVSDTPQALAYEPTNVPSGKYRIGANKDGAQFFLGDIDDVQIYNVALTATELRQIYEDRAFSATEPYVDSYEWSARGYGRGFFGFPWSFTF